MYFVCIAGNLGGLGGSTKGFSNGGSGNSGSMGFPNSMGAKSPMGGQPMGGGGWQQQQQPQRSKTPTYGGQFSP